MHITQDKNSKEHKLSTAHKNKTEIKKYRPSEKEKKVYGNFIIENNDNFVVINKPAGIPVQSGTKSFKNISIAHARKKT